MGLWSSKLMVDGERRIGEGGNPVTRDAVVWAYRILLDRDPESETVIAIHRGHSSVAELRKVIMSSEEFRIRVHMGA